MTSLFSLLAVELVEEIVSYLDFCDVAALRLTSRHVEQKASYGSFTNYFKSANIDLTWESLEFFVNLTKHGGLGTHFQHCTISGIARNLEITTSEQEEQTELLRQAFENLKRHSPRKALASLTIRTSPISEQGSVLQDIPTYMNPFRSPRNVFEAASSAFAVTIKALQSVALSVEEGLNVCGTVKGCSLTSVIANEFLHNPVSMQPFLRIKALVVSLAAPFEAFVEQSLEAETLSEVQTRYSCSVLRTVLRTLRRLPLLEVLEVHWYRHDKVIETYQRAALPSSNIDVDIEEQSLPQLQQCVLRGLYLTSTSLSDFLVALQPCHVRLENVSLTTNTTWEVIFRHITESETIKSVHLDDLYESSVLVHFPRLPGGPKWPSSGFQLGPTTASFKAPYMHRAGAIMDYRIATYTTPRSSWQYSAWRVGRGEEYGPPWRGKYYEYEKYNQKKASDQIYDRPLGIVGSMVASRAIG